MSDTSGLTKLGVHASIPSPYIYLGSGEKGEKAGVEEQGQQGHRFFLGKVRVPDLTLHLTFDKDDRTYIYYRYFSITSII